MLNNFVKQAQRIFSSKKYGAKLVDNPTDRLHNWKLILFGLSIVFIIGYSQFREHFKCFANEQLDSKILTNFCWLNGTTTLDLTNESGDEVEDESVSHTMILS